MSDRCIRRPCALGLACLALLLVAGCGASVARSTGGSDPLYVLSPAPHSYPAQHIVTAPDSERLPPDQASTLSIEFCTDVLWGPTGLFIAADGATTFIDGKRGTTARFTMAPDHLRRLQTLALGLYPLAAQYHASVYDGTLWALRLRTPTGERRMVFGNHFPDPVRAFAEALSRTIASHLPAAATADITREGAEAAFASLLAVTTTSADSHQRTGISRTTP